MHCRKYQSKSLSFVDGVQAKWWRLSEVCSLFSFPKSKEHEEKLLFITVKVLFASKLTKPVFYDKFRLCSCVLVCNKCQLNASTASMNSRSYGKADQKCPEGWYFRHFPLVRKQAFLSWHHFGCWSIARGRIGTHQSSIHATNSKGLQRLTKKRSAFEIWSLSAFRASA